MAGDVRGAQRYAADQFPGLRVEDDETCFLLKTQVFIELLAPGGAALDEALAYGRDELLPFHDRFPDRLEEVYSLLAYTDPASSPVAHLVRAERRELVAERLNMAILRGQGRPDKSLLETLIAQTQVVLGVHGEVANGPAALVQGVDDFC
jgi:Ran-binding protein 9/10